MGIALQIHNRRVVAVGPYSADIESHAGCQVEENEPTRVRTSRAQNYNKTISNYSTTDDEYYNVGSTADSLQIISQLIIWHPV